MTFDEITKTITREQAAKLSIKKLALFEYFNPNGAVAEKRAADEAISAAVDAGALKSGAILAYGSMNSYHEDHLRAQMNRKRPRGWDVRYHAEQLRKQAQRATQIAAEAMATKAAE